MPTERLSMRKVREVLTLRWGRGLSERQVALSCGIGRTTVQGYVGRAKRAGLSWPLEEGLSDEELEALLFPPPPAPGTERAVPDWVQVNRQLKKKGVTLWLLWEEYKAVYPDGFQYSWFCVNYKQWAKTLDVTMRQPHKAGEKLFVDYAGQTMEVIDRATGEILDAQRRAHEGPLDLQADRRHADWNPCAVNPGDRLLVHQHARAFPFEHLTHHRRDDAGTRALSLELLARPGENPLGCGVDDKRHRKERERGEKEHTVMGCAPRGFGQFCG